MTEISDWSGKIHIKLFTKRTYYPSGHHELEVKVSDDYVLVGGGAQTIYNSDAAGSFITESRPNADLKTWHARSKDHINPGKHSLVVFAIGLKIDGVTSTYLRSKMRIFSKESGVANHPSTNISIPNNYLLVGGGAKVKYGGYGNLLVHSYPKTNTSGNGYSWYVKSKDHQVADRATIVAYAIGIENISFPNIGHVEVNVNGGGTPFGQGSGSAQESFVRPHPGWALTCSGGKSDYSGEGRMITSIYPYLLSAVKAASTDHIQGSNGHIRAYAVSIRKRR
jgi:hypothetical protein